MRHRPSAWNATLALTHHSQIGAIVTSSGKPSLTSLPGSDRLLGVLIAPASLIQHT